MGGFWRTGGRPSQGVVPAGDVNRHAVEPVHQDIAAPDRRPLYCDAASLRPGQGNAGGVGVGPGNILADKFPLKPPLRRMSQGVPDTGVVGRKAQNAGDQGLVRPVAPVCLGKGTAELNFRSDRLLLQNLPGYIAQPHRPGGVGAGRANHNRTNHVKYVQVVLLPSLNTQTSVYFLLPAQDE